MAKNSLWGLLLKNKQSLATTELTLVNYYLWIKSLALSVFEWQGLPETINVRYLEETLFSKGKCLFFYDDRLGFLSLACSPANDVNVYGEPLMFNVNSYYYQKTIRANDSVLIRNNDIEEPTQYQVSAFANRLTEVERTTDINLKAQKTPLLILTDDKTQLTLKNVYRQYASGEPVIYGDKSIFNSEVLKVFKTDAPYIIDKLDTHKKYLWDEVLTYLGINNSNTEKKERLIVDEVNANNQNVELNANVMLKTRLEACNEINKKYGSLLKEKVTVRLRTRIEIEEETETGVKDEPIYDRA